MRYLKLFNESMDEFYQEINYTEYYGLIEGDTVKTDKILSESEKEIIKEMFPTCSIHLSKNWTQLEISINSKYKFILLDKNIDEWYIIKYQTIRGRQRGSYFDTYYKCDQFDGLLELLKNILS